MGFDKVVVPSEKDLIIQQLEGKIVSGELPVGARLPTERELAGQLGVSKSVLHFALKDLEQLRFLRCVPRHGTYVNDWINHGNFDTLNSVLRLQGVNVDLLKDSLIHMRNVIESDAMELCSERCTESDFAELQAAIDALKNAPEDAEPVVYARYIMQFHHLIMLKSGNSMYPLMMNSFADFSLVLWVHCVEYWTRSRILSFEQEQLDMIRSGNGHEAGKKIRQMYAEFLSAHAQG